MPFSWSAYLTLAQELAGRSGDEAAQRSAISRAYYAVYNLALVKIRVLQITTDEQLPPHERVWTSLMGHSEEIYRSIGILGDRLKKSRRMADYDDVIKNVPSETAQALVLARLVEGRLQKLTPPLAQ